MPFRLASGYVQGLTLLPLMLPRSATPRRANLPVVLSASVAILVASLVVVPLIGVVSGTSGLPPAAVSAQTGTWSFGKVTTASVQGNDSSGTYSGSVTYGFVTNITAVNTSATTIEVIVQETVGISLSLQYCRPNCAKPLQITQFSYQGWQTRDAWTNLSAVANVTETFTNSTIPAVVNALGIINSTVQARGGASEAASDTRHGADNVTRVSSVTAAYRSSSNSTVAFTPSLGLLPTGPIASGDSWVSTALYQGSADWGAHWVLNLTGPRGKSAVSTGSTGAEVSIPTRSVTLVGSAGESGVQVHATRLLAIGYYLTGNLRLGPGLAISWAAPGGFGEGLPGSSNWTVDSVVRANVQLSSLDALPGAGLAARLQSSQVSFSLNVRDPNNGNVNDTIPQSSVNGASMTPAQASSTATCLQQAGVCATTVGSGSGLGSNGTVLIVVGSVVVLAALAAAVLVTRQRRIPPPQYPNAGLYPPGQPLPPSRTNPAEPKVPNRPSSGASDDPLDQLW
jgi:hypothetical protein